MTFGESLKSIRKQRGLNQAELAKLLGTTRQTINRYERSEREPNVRTAAVYADILGISIEELTGQKEKPTTVFGDELAETINSRPLLWQLMESLSRLDDEHLQAFITLAGVPTAPKDE